jgi:hypothetical protein
VHRRGGKRLPFAGRGQSSGGIAIEDAVAAVAVYEKACEAQLGQRFDFSA